MNRHETLLTKLNAIKNTAPEKVEPLLEEAVMATLHYSPDAAHELVSEVKACILEQKIFEAFADLFGVSIDEAREAELPIGYSIGMLEMGSEVDDRVMDGYRVADVGFFLDRFLKYVETWVSTEVRPMQLGSARH